MNIRDEIKQYVNEELDLQWDTDEIPFSKMEFINSLTEKFKEIQEKAMKEKLLEAINNRFNTFKFN